MKEPVDKAILDSLSDETLAELTNEIRGFAQRMFDGTATPEDREEFKSGLNELYIGWVEFTTKLLQRLEEPPLSLVALDFYSLMDCNRAMIDQPPRSMEMFEEIQSENREQGNDRSE
jgi:hypothetical protein